MSANSRYAGEGKNMATLLQVVIPAVLIFTTLFGLLSRGDPRPGGVALFWRVGLVGLGLGALAWYLTFKTNSLLDMPEFVRNLYRGLLVGGFLLTAFAGVGTWLKNKQR
jgi:hypothetical protein